MWGTATVSCTSTQHTRVSVFTSYRGSGGMPPFKEKNFFGLLRLLLMQSETKFPAIILMTHR